MPKSFIKLFIVSSMLLLLVADIEAQFFTKSSKSIPRMGRRSDGGLNSMSDVETRRAIIDNLIDKFGSANLIAALEAKAAGENIVPGNEVELKNEQPMDEFEPAVMDNYFVYPSNSDQLMARRSASGRNPQLDVESRNSLAMRALNAERFMRHLTSGQPLMPLSKVMLNQQQMSPKLSSDD